MSLPYKVATLLYCFNEQDEVLLLAGGIPSDGNGAS